MKTNLLLKVVLSLGLTALVPSTMVAQTVLFSDDFETNSSSRYLIMGGANASNGNTNDFAAVFATNYVQMTYRLNGATPNIPPAPHSTSNTAHGLYLTANKLSAAGSTGKAAAVSLYPKNLVCSNNYALRFDMWIDYNGDAAGGGTGSTEFATFGINHTATEVNWALAANGAGDGVWFAADGECGTTRDYRTYSGPNDAELTSTTGGFYDRNLDSTIDQGADYSDFSQANPFWDVFPVPPGQSAGAPGKRWTTVEVKQVNGVITWSMNGYVFASAPTTPQAYTVGDIMIGYMDNLTGVANPKNENYAIIDNLQVIDLGPSASFSTVSINATKTDATKPGGGSSTYGIFTVSQTDAAGNPITSASPLTVQLAISGTASNGLDYTSIPSTATIPAGASSVDINIIPTSRIANPSDSVFIKLTGSTNYELRTHTYASLNITDPRGVPAADLSVYKPVAYENFHKAAVNVTMASPSSSDLTINYVVGGTATGGVHYVTLPGSVVVPANTTNATIIITPINNSVIDSNRTVTITLTNGTGYRIGTSSNATVTVRNDDLTPGASVLFSDKLDTDTSLNWNINQTDPSDPVIFAYDYSADGIPSAPHTTNATTIGVKLQPDYSTGLPAGITLSPKNVNFTGDYRLRFDAWVNYNGDQLTGLPGGGSQSTENLIAGVGTTGTHVQGTTNVASDGVWFRVNSDASSTVADDFGAFTANTELLVGSSTVYVGNSQGASSSYYSEFGLEAAPQVQVDNAIEQSGLTYRGCIGFAWHDYVITKQGSTVTWSIDGLPIAVVPFTNTVMSSNVFIGFTDPVAGSSPLPSMSFAVIDNVTVESLVVVAPTAPTVTSVQKSGNSMVINFTGSGSDSAGSFSVVGSSTLSNSSAAYTAVPGAVVTGSGGVFQATVPINAAANFCRIKR